MRISEFAELYGVTRREVEYWTTLKLIHCEPKRKSSYKDYGPQAEKDIKKIIICKAMGLSMTSDVIKKFEVLDDEFWREAITNRIKREEEKTKQLYSLAYRIVKEGIN